MGQLVQHDVAGYLSRHLAFNIAQYVYRTVLEQRHESLISLFRRRRTEYHTRR